MDTDLLFEEVQEFTKKSSRFFLSIFVGVLLFYSLALFLFRRPDNADVFLIVLPLTLIVGILLYVLAKARLITEIRRDGIHVRFYPFHRTFKRFSWEMIDQLYIRQYDPLREFGGWGVRMGPSGRAFNVSGHTGIQLILKNGSRLLIGTQLPDEMEHFLGRLGKLNFSSN